MSLRKSQPITFTERKLPYDGRIKIGWQKGRIVSTEITYAAPVPLREFKSGKR